MFIRENIMAQRHEKAVYSVKWKGYNDETWALFERCVGLNMYLSAFRNKQDKANVEFLKNV